MDWTGIAGTVGKFAPLLGGALGGPAGGAIGALVASALGSDATPDAVASALEVDPEAAVKLRTLESEERVALKRITFEHANQTLVAETARIEAVNATMRAEARAEDPWTRRWRPFWGFISAIAFTLQVGGIVFLMVDAPPGAAELIASLGSLSVFWGVPLAILGVSAWHRGVEKRIKAGETNAGIGGAVAALRGG